MVCWVLGLGKRITGSKVDEGGKKARKSAFTEPRTQQVLNYRAWEKKREKEGRGERGRGGGGGEGGGGGGGGAKEGASRR